MRVLRRNAENNNNNTKKGLLNEVTSMQGHHCSRFGIQAAGDSRWKLLFLDCRLTGQNPQILSLFLRTTALSSLYLMFADDLFSNGCCFEDLWWEGSPLFRIELKMMAGWEEGHRLG